MKTSIMAGGAQSKVTAAPHQKQSAEVVWASDRDVDFRGFAGMSKWEETLNSGGYYPVWPGNGFRSP